MDAEREREIRALSLRLISSQRHRRIGLVLGELIQEIDLLREGDDVAAVDYEGAIRRLQEAGSLAQATRRSGSDEWRRSVEIKKADYAAGER